MKREKPNTWDSENRRVVAARYKAARASAPKIMKTSEMKTAAADERKRIKHTIDRARSILDSIEMSIGFELASGVTIPIPGPIGNEAAQAITQVAQEIAGQIARHDVFDRLDAHARVAIEIPARPTRMFPPDAIAAPTPPVRKKTR